MINSQDELSAGSRTPDELGLPLRCTVVSVLSPQATWPRVAPVESTQRQSSLSVPDPRSCQETTTLLAGLTDRAEGSWITRRQVPWLVRRSLA